MIQELLFLWLWTPVKSRHSDDFPFPSGTTGESVSIIFGTQRPQVQILSHRFLAGALGVRWTPVKRRPERSAEPETAWIKGFRFFLFFAGGGKAARFQGVTQFVTQCLFKWINPLPSWIFRSGYFQKSLIAAYCSGNRYWVSSVHPHVLSNTGAVSGSGIINIAISFVFSNTLPTFLFISMDTLLCRHFLFCSVNINFLFSPKIEGY